MLFRRRLAQSGSTIRGWDAPFAKAHIRGWDVPFANGAAYSRIRFIRGWYGTNAMLGSFWRPIGGRVRSGVLHVVATC